MISSQNSCFLESATVPLIDVTKAFSPDPLSRTFAEPLVASKALFPTKDEISID